MVIVRSMSQDAGPAVNPPFLVPASEVARLLGISKRTLWRLLCAISLGLPIRKSV